MSRPRIGRDDKPMAEDERRAVETLERLAQRWPKTLMLASMAGALHVIRLDDDDEPMAPDGIGLDPDASIATIKIRNTGGDW